MSSKISDSQQFSNTIASSSFIETDETVKDDSNFKLSRRFTIVTNPKDDFAKDDNVIIYSKADDVKNNSNSNENGNVCENSVSPGNVVNKRDDEGQDTITSMIGKPFLRNFEKIRRSSLKSNGTINDQNLSENLSNNLSDSSLSGSDFISTVQSGFRSLFRKRKNSQTSLDSEEKRNKLLDFIKSDANLFTPIDQVNVSGNDVLDVRMIDSNKMLVPNDEVVQSKSDQVFEVLKQAIDKNDEDFLDKNFIEQVIQTVKFQQLKTKQHKENVKRLCRVLELLVFFIITSMTIFLVINVFGQLKLIYKISEATIEAEIKTVQSNVVFDGKRVVFNKSEPVI